MVFFVLPAGPFSNGKIGANIAQAVDGNWVAGLLSWILLALASIVGNILSFVLKIVNWLFSFQEFDIPGVKEGWVIVRDICNMSFILVLLLIAFATILRLENYSMKKNLPKLLIMAVMINFSKTICLLLIDASQIVMLTFANAFANASSNFVTMLQIDKLLALQTTTEWADFSWGILYAIGLAFVFILIAFCVMMMLMGILVMRLIMFWVLIILSPLAFLCTAVPGAEKYWSQWWGEFTKYLIVGPVLAFFTWLSLNIAQKASFGIGEILSTSSGKIQVNSSWISAMNDEKVQQFVLAIGLLIGTIKITQSFGAMGASFGANLAGKMKNTGIALGKKVVTSPYKVTKAVVNTGAGMALTGASNWDGLKNRLGSIGGRRIPFVANLATKTLTGLESRKKKEEEKAKSYVGSIKDTRILGRLANQTGFTPWRAAVKDAAVQKAPSQVGTDPATRLNDIQDAYNKAKKEAYEGWSENEWRRLGQSGINFGGNSKAEEYMQKDRTARGAVNSGIGVNTFFGLDRRGVPYRAGTGTPGPVPAPANANAYRKGAPKEESAGAGGASIDPSKDTGRMSVNSFVNHGKNEIAVDFDAMGIDALGEDIKDELKDVAGVNIIDQEKIKNASKRIVQVIDKEIDKLTSKSVLKKGEMRRLGNMKEARKKLSNPENIENLSLINSGYRGYRSLGDVKKTLVHERIHGYGLRDEEQTDKITKETMQTKKYSGLEGKAHEVMHKKSVEEIMELENHNYGTGRGVESSKEIIKEKETIKEVVRGDSTVSSVLGNVSGASTKNLIYALNFLNKQIVKLNYGQSNLYKKLMNMKLQGEPTKLELKFAVDKIKKEIDI